MEVMERNRSRGRSWQQIASVSFTFISTDRFSSIPYWMIWSGELFPPLKVQNVQVNWKFFLRCCRVFECAVFLQNRQQKETPQGISTLLLVVNVGWVCPGLNTQLPCRHSNKLTPSLSHFQFRNSARDTYPKLTLHIKVSSFISRLPVTGLLDFFITGDFLQRSVYLCLLSDW